MDEFSKKDLNEDGKISYREFRKMLCIRFSDAEVIAMFDNWDADKDGYISYSLDPDNKTAEFCKTNRNRIDFARAQMDKMIEEFVERNKRLKMKIHTIGLGHADYKMLQKLAALTNAKFVDYSRRPR